MKERVIRDVAAFEAKKAIEAKETEMLQRPRSDGASKKRRRRREKPRGV